MAQARKKTAKTKTRPKKVVKKIKTRPEKTPRKREAKPAGRRGSFLKEVRQKLLATKNRLLAEVAHKVKSESDVLKFELGDIYDIASTERERELTLMLGDREREKLHEIDRALERLDDKDYGLCEECGEPIGEERLRAMPFTRVCFECKSKSEKETFIKGRVEEETPLGILEKTEPEEEF